jgi:hypothetical protein
VCLFNHAWPGTAQVRRRRPLSRARDIARVSRRSRRRTTHETART